MNPKYQNKLSIVIVSWNTCELLESCLESIYKQDLGGIVEDVETIVVDNVSSDGSAAMVRSKFPEAMLIENEVNKGFAVANNQGLRYAKGRYILLLNPDTELYEGSLKTLLELLEASPEASACGPRLLNPDGSLQTSVYPFINLFREFWRLFYLDSIKDLSRYPLQEWSLVNQHRVDVIMGACLLLRREALDEVGLLDEDYFIYTEEVDLCYRMSRAGWKLYWEPRSQVLHHGGQSTRQAKLEMFLKLYESKVLFFKKHNRASIVAAYKLLLTLVAFSRIVGAKLMLWQDKNAETKQRSLELQKHYRQLALNVWGF